MNRVVGKIEEERSRLVAIDERDRLLGQPVRQISFVVDPILVAVDRMHELSVGVAAQVKVAVPAATHEFVTFIETAIHRVPLQFGVILIQTKVPFADCRRNIFLRKERWKNRQRWIKATTTVTRRVNTDALLVTS